MLNLDIIPRRQERLIVARAGLDWGRHKLSAVFGTNPASHVEEGWVMTAVFVGHLSAQPMTAYRISKLIGMPRTTVLRKLEGLIRKGVIRLSGRGYLASDALLQEPHGFDEVVSDILTAADQLRDMQKYASVPGS
jgi:hypothetical protein